MHEQMHIPDGSTSGRTCEARMQLFVHTQINRWTRAITLLLCTSYLILNTSWIDLSRIFIRNDHFDMVLLPLFFLFMSVWHTATVRDLGNAAETNCWAHAPLLLAEKLRRGQNKECQNAINVVVVQVCEWYQSLTAHQHQNGHTVPKQVWSVLWV